MDFPVLFELFNYKVVNILSKVIIKIRYYELQGTN